MTENQRTEETRATNLRHKGCGGAVVADGIGWECWLCGLDLCEKDWTAERDHDPGCHCLEFGCPAGIASHGCYCGTTPAPVKDNPQETSR